MPEKYVLTIGDYKADADIYLKEIEAEIMVRSKQSFNLAYMLY